MKLYLLWFNEYESNTILGVFSTKEEAEMWKLYFIEHPSPEIFMMDTFDQDEREDSINVEEVTLDILSPRLKMDNLTLVEVKARIKNLV